MTKYVACKRRNVAAAYERFLGPSSGALDGVKPEPWHSRTWNGFVELLMPRHSQRPPGGSNRS
jgi:hypothetical protein